MSAVSLRNVSHSYDGVQALRGVSLDVEQGSFLAVFGQNGAGKTTIARVMGGLLRPSSGQVLVGRKEVRGSSRGAGLVKQGVCVIPEGRRLFSDLSIADNLKLGAYAQRLGRKELAQRLDTALDLLPTRLTERLDAKAGHLSGGERQLVALARALMAAPRVLVADEPSLGLAPQAIQTTYAILRRLNAEGITIVVIEQEATSALRCANRVVVVRRGQIAFESEDAAITMDELRGLYFGERHDREAA